MATSYHLEQESSMLPPRFDIDMLLSLRQPAIRMPLHLSPDGALLAVSSQSKRRAAVAMEQRGVTGSGMPLEALGSTVHLVGTADGADREPFGTDETSWCAQWSPDGRMLAAYVTRTEEPFLAVWRRDNGAVRLYERAPVRPFFGFEVPRWTPDSRSIVVKLAPAASAPAVPDHEPQLPSAGLGGVTVYSFDPLANKCGPTRLPGWSTPYLCDLGVINVETGEARRLATGWALSGWKVAPDGSAVALLKDVAADQTLQQFYFDLVVVPLDGGEPRIVARRVPQHYGICFNWSPDSRRIAYTTRERKQVSRLFVASADGSAPPVDLTDLHADLELAQAYEPPRWTSDGQRIFCLIPGGFCEFATDGSWRRKVQPRLEREVVGWVQRPTELELWCPAGDEGLLLVTRDARTKNMGLARVEPASGTGSVLVEVEAHWQGETFGVEALADGSGCYLLLEAAHHPPEVWHVSITNPKPKCLFKLNPALADLALGSSRVIEYRALDGEVRRAALLLPTDYEEGRRLPVVVEVYGGGTGSEGRHVFGGSAAVFNWQLLAARGYAVLWPDMPLSNGDPMRQLPGLVLPAVDRLIDLGIGDPTRLGLIGQSYGGYCVLALITETPRFRAAVAVAGTVDLISHYGSLSASGDSRWLGWAESGQGGLGGSLWEKRAAFIENSPLFYLDRVETPLLLVCGTREPEEASQAGEAFSALRRLDKHVEARLYEGEDHWPGMWTETSFRDMCRAVIGWFDQHLGLAQF